MTGPAARLGLRALRGGIAFSTFTIFGLRIVFLGLSFVSGVVLARILGVEMFGHYSLALAWTGFLGVVATLGLPELITREVPARVTRGAWSSLRGLLIWSDLTILIFSTLLALIAIGVAWYFIGRGTPALFYAIAFAFASLPAYGLSRSTTSTIQGFRFPVASSLPELVVRPLVFLVLIGLLYLLYTRDLTGAGATAAFSLSRVVALVSCYVILWRMRPKRLAEARPTFRGREWLRSSLPFLAISSIYVVSAYTDSIMLGFLRSPDEVGIYSVANQGAQLILFALMAVNVIVTPEVSRLWVEGNVDHLQRVVTHAARIASVVALAIAVALIAFGHFFLLIFGAEFTIGYGALVLLAIAQLVNAVTGLAGPILSMTGFERSTMRGFVIGACANVALNALLIPVAGVNGAALATALSIVLQNVLLARWVRAKLGIDSLPFGSGTVGPRR